MEVRETKDWIARRELAGTQDLDRATTLLAEHSDSRVGDFNLPDMRLHNWEPTVGNHHIQDFVKTGITPVLLKSLLNLPPTAQYNCMF